MSATLKGAAGAPEQQALQRLIGWRWVRPTTQKLGLWEKPAPPIDAATLRAWIHDRTHTLT
jgi:hypothetical protein